MTNFCQSDFNILFDDVSHKRKTGLAENIACTNNQNSLFDEYEKLRECAPRRTEKDKSYFVDSHDGKIPGKLRCPQKWTEKHLARALWNEKKRWPRPCGGWVCLLDYEFPLKSKDSDKIGEVDLLGVTDEGRLMIIELKVKPRRPNNPGDTPLKALMQGLRYAAVVEANRDTIAKEAKNPCNVNVDITDEPPIVQILAPRTWWKGWFEIAGSTRNEAGEWEPAFARLAGEIEEGRIGVSIECMALEDIDDGDITYGADDRTPTLCHAPAFYPVLPSEKQPIADNLPLPEPGDQE